MLDLVESNKQTLTLGEYITGGSVFLAAPKFTGPVDVVNGINDLPNCFGNCLLPVNLAAALRGKFYPAGSNGSSWYLGQGSGHFLNYHYAAPGAYDHIQSFIKKNGL